MMGGLKQQLISEQVELADRIAPPRSATTHASWEGPSRRQMRQIQFLNRRRNRGVVMEMILMYLLGVITVSAMWVLVEVFS